MTTVKQARTAQANLRVVRIRMRRRYGALKLTDPHASALAHKKMMATFHVCRDLEERIGKAVLPPIVRDRRDPARFYHPIVTLSC